MNQTYAWSGRTKKSIDFFVNGRIRTKNYKFTFSKFLRRECCSPTSAIIQRNTDDGLRKGLVGSLRTSSDLHSKQNLDLPLYLDFVHRYLLYRINKSPTF
jgi:hypothetical protein